LENGRLKRGCQEAHVPQPAGGETLILGDRDRDRGMRLLWPCSMRATIIIFLCFYISV